MYLNDKDFVGAMIVFVVVVALAGWGVIEGLIWLSGFIDISIGAPQ